MKHVTMPKEPQAGMKWAVLWGPDRPEGRRERQFPDRQDVETFIARWSGDISNPTRFEWTENGWSQRA